MVKPHKLGKTTRMSFSKIDEVLEIPNLLEVQKKSYQWFLEEGLREVLRDVSPIIDYSGNKYIEFVDYSIDETPKYPEEECKDRDVNYCAPLRVKVRLYNKSTDESFRELGKEIQRLNYSTSRNNKTASLSSSNKYCSC